MMDHSLRREWPLALGGFALGLLLAALTVGLWIMLTRGTAQSFDVTARPRTSAPDRGLIGSAYAGISGRLEAERRVANPIRGGLPFRITGIVWQDRAGPAFARVQELRGRLDTHALQTGDIVVRGLLVRAGNVLLEQNDAKEWNYKRVMAPLLEREESGGRTRAFVVTDIALQNATVRVHTPERSFVIADLAAQLPRADFAGPQLAAPRVTIARATGSLMVGDSSYRLVAENGTATFPTEQVDFDVGVLRTGNTRVTSLSGSYGGALPGVGLAISADVTEMHFADVRFLSERLPASGSAAFHLTVRPISSALTEIQIGNARLESGASRVGGSVTIHMGEEAFALDAIDARFDPLSLSLVEQLIGDTLPYQGTVSGTARGSNGIISFDANTHLVSRNVREPLVAHVTGSARLASDGFEIRRVEADLRDVPLASLRAVMPSLPLAGSVSGRIALTGAPGRAPLEVNVRLELGNGLALIDGTVDLTDSIPRYDIAGRLVAINLQRLFEPGLPPVFLSARFAAVGSGVDPELAMTRVRVDGQFSGWRTEPGDTVHLVARLDAGTLQIDAATLELATMSAHANGSWRFAAPSSGSIKYRIAFDPITPFGPYIPAIGDEDAAGNMRVDGSVDGDRSRLRIAGNADGSNLLAGGWKASSLDGKYAFVIGPAVPEITFQGTARNLTTPTAGEYASARADVRLQSPTFALDVRAQRAGDSGGIEIVADGRVPPTGAREVILHRAHVDLAQGAWELTGPAVFSWEAPRTDIEVRGLELRKSDNVGLLKLDGRVLPLAGADFRLETVALPIGDIQRLLGRPTRVSGALTTTADVRSENGVPQISARFQLDTAVIEDVRFTQLRGDASYLDRKLVANANATVDTAGVLQLKVELPVDLRFGPDGGAKLLDSGAVNVTLTSDSMALAPFATLHPDIEELDGRIAANVAVTGTVEEPVLAGSITIRDASVRFIPLNQTMDSINGVIALENRRAVIRDFVARSGGQVRATGSIEFEDLKKPVLDITATLAGMQLLGVDNQNDARATGEIRLRGPFSAAVLSGDVRLADGFLPIPQTGTRALDAELARFEADLPSGGESQPQTSFYRSLAIQGLRIRAGENLWFSMEDARAELAGDLTINKNGDALIVVGELTGERGTYTMRAGPIIRRFDVLAAQIRFLGGTEINPALDITARRRVVDLNGRQIDIDVRIRGTMERPTLALASEDAGTIPQSELLSFILFGRPSVALGGSTAGAPSELIGEAYIGGIAELLSMELEQAFVDQMGMGVDIFQIRLGGGQLNNLDTFGASIVVGEQIRNNVFLTVESGVAALFGGAGETSSPTFAVRLEWGISRNMNVRASYEPVTESTVLRNYTITPTDRKYQPTIELRRRWTW